MSKVFNNLFFIKLEESIFFFGEYCGVGFFKMIVRYKRYILLINEFIKIIYKGV